MMKRGFLSSKEFDDYEVETEYKVLKEWKKRKEKEIKEVYKGIAKPYNAEYKKF